MLGVTSQTIVIFTFHMLLLDGKSFFRSQKDLKLIYLWASISLELWLVIHFQYQNKYVEWLVMVAWCFQPNYCYIHFQYFVAWWKIIFQNSKRPQTHLLMSFNSIRIMAGYTFSIYQKSICGVIGDGGLVFPAKLLLYSLSIY